MSSVALVQGATFSDVVIQTLLEMKDGTIKVVARFQQDTREFIFLVIEAVSDIWSYIVNELT
jgi:hypothetical protein